MANSPDQDALALIDEGNAIEDAGRIDEAMQRYEAAIRLAPNLARAHLNRGNALLAKGDAEAARTAYTTAISCNSNYAGAHYNLGNACVRLGRRDDALAAYQRAIALNPDFADAEVALGGLMEDLGRPDDAIACYRRALEINPGYAQVHCNLGNALKAAGKRDEALESYRRAVEADHAFAVGYYALGNALRENGDFDGATDTYRRALELNPGYVEALYGLCDALQLGNRLDEAIAAYGAFLANTPQLPDVHVRLGNVLRENGRHADALERYQRALAIAPGHAIAHNNSGIALQALGKLEDAAASYRRAIALEPGNAQVYCNLGNLLKDLGRLDEATEMLRQALTLQGGAADIRICLGRVLIEAGKFRDAAECMQQVIELDPTHVSAHIQLGNALHFLGQYGNAVAHYRRALEIDPADILARNNLGTSLKDFGQLDQAIECYRQVLSIDPCNWIAHDGLLFIGNYLTDAQPAQLLADAMRFGELAEREASPYTDWPNDPDPERRLRVGLVSGDFRNHVCAYFLEGALVELAALDACPLQFFAYSNHAAIDGFTTRIRASCIGWRMVDKLPDKDLVHRIREDGIDILIDLAGHTAFNRLPAFAWKPAPVQATWLGYFATTGLRAIDYFVADPFTLPPSEEAYFTEMIWRLPETRLCFTPPPEDVPVARRIPPGDDKLTFGCFQNLSKLNDQVVVVWARILHDVPDSRLLVIGKQLVDDTVRSQTFDRFVRLGMDPQRIALERPLTRRDYLDAYNRVDIALDPFPYPGGTTTAESLWMGVPVLTLAGERLLSRQSAGLLVHAGLADWIAVDPDDYVKRAAKHASDRVHLESLRQGLRQRVLASPIFDAPRFARHFEGALRGMWRKWCDQQRPR